MAALDALMAWLDPHDLRGYDPYDALTNPLLARLGKRSSLVGRLVIQMLRYLPLNVRPQLRIAPAFDAKALGLLARGYVHIWDKRQQETVWRRAEECLDVLGEIRISGFSGTCWGHPFPYRSSRSYLPADFPNVVSTVYSAQPFLDAYERVGDPKYLEVARSAAHFILEDLPRLGTDEVFCFSYYPGVELPIHNANLLAAAFVARVARLTDEPAWFEPISAAVRYTLQDQQPDGSWFYDGPDSETRDRTFIDGFHTGFVLESLFDIAQYTDVDVQAAMTSGLTFYLENLFDADGRPRHAVRRAWPLDLRDCAQAIIVLSRLHALDARAERLLHHVVDWTTTHMQASQGYFYYLRWKGFVTLVPYIRFQGWMLAALARYLPILGARPEDRSGVS